MILKLPEQLEKFNFYVEKLRKHKGSVRIDKINKKRTIRQNAFLHVLIQLFAIETGYTLDEAKTLLKRKSECMVYTKQGERFLKRTRDLDTKELSEFIEWIRNFAGANGFYLPNADEYLRDWERIDQEIHSHKPYL
jgi:hypothetical protein